MPAKKKATATAGASELIITVKGEVISSNFDAFREMAEARIDSINFDLTTDEDFEQAAQDVKSLKGFEDTLTLKEDEILKALGDINLLITGTRELKGLTRKSRLELNKIVTDQSALMRANLLKDGYAALAADCRDFRAKIEESIKGKKSLEKMKEAITATVKGINAQVEECRKLIDAAAEGDHGNAITYGRQEMLFMSPDTVRSELERRKERIVAEIERQRLIDETNRLKREADEKAAEQVAKEKAAQAEAPAPEPQPEPESAKQPEPVSLPKEPAVTDEGFSPEAAAELRQFIDTTQTAFTPVKAAREALKHPQAIAAAEAFAMAIIPAWKSLTSILPE